MRLCGGALRLLGRAEEALTQHKRIIAFLDALDCPVSGHVADLSRVRTIHGLGLDYAALGRWREAADHYRDAQVRSSRIDILHREALLLVHLGEALIELGETEEARSCLRQILAFGEAAYSDDLETAQSLLDSLPATRGGGPRAQSMR
ncbi:tetratricopeptide repeat protein [Streptomyces sp. NPDC048106]|uniref:tetratricopeptide repeat protein n=1 Tax=Streptomyces sp. NPDC048106 TaxID=3155750 RepID=UPI0034571D3B